LSKVDHDVVIVGGGIGGLGTALALARSGVRAQVLERAPEFSEVGAGLQMGPNAVRALDRLGVLGRIYGFAVFPERGVISNAVTGERLTTIDFQDPMIARFGYPYLVLHRNDILTVLLEACREHPLVGLENDRTVEHVVDEGDRMRIVCADGSELTAALVVGADGLNSRVRRLIRDDEPTFSGDVAFRGTTRIEDLGAGERTNDVLLWIGPGAHLIQYPVRRGELYNQVAVFRSVRFAEGREDWGTPEELVERFAGMSDIVRAAIPTMTAARAYPNYDKEPIDTFVAGRAVLIGDAAHPMLQYLGQGACQALEDGLTLAAVLGGSVEHPTATLAEYDSLRVPRTTRSQRAARPWGKSWHTDDPISVAYRDRYFRARRSDDYSEVEWLYDDILPVQSPPLQVKEQS
jgi:salicylate hydroxylase